MNKYSEGKIYKIIDNTNGDIYIGSTCNTLRHRLNKHICHIAEFYTNKKKYYCRAACIIMNGDYNIELIKHYPCNNKRELELEETKYIKNTDCINSSGNGLSSKEYRELNRDKIKEKKRIYHIKNNDRILNQKREYRQLNSEIINEKQRIQILCTCGKYTSKVNKLRHELTKIHINYINSLNPE
jgi:hypothetical protein